ncbi:hypothetical protein PUN28_013925 [Cardiocondyla obscurior]|uniref:USP domain-containing protein n=1 Tax=Cardiocondyla obscurior TaxID=286306 RepID=A0AAW2F3R2_9HYME
MSSNTFIKFTIDILKRGKILATDYRVRGSILWNTTFLQKKSIGCKNVSVSSLNANCNAAKLIENLFESIPSYTTDYRCCKCGYIYNRKSPTCNINVDEILKHGLNNMQQAIHDNVIISKKNKKKQNAINAKIILIQTKYTLNDVSKTIKLENDNYSLAGLISYIKYGKKYSDGHYIAMAYTGMQWYKYNDMPGKRFTIHPTEEICPHLILYVKT